MQQHILPINEILVEDRQRIDLGDIDILADSLSKYGLIQPIVINQNKRLIAGGRRLTAAKKLGWTEIKVVYLETLTEEDLTIRELEENIQRKAMTWKEEVAAVYKMHKLLDKRAHFDGNSWTQEQTGRMLGVSRASVGFTIQIAKELLNQSSKIHQCESYTEALRWCFQKREDEIQAELVSELKTQMEANRALVRETVKYVVEEEVDDKSSTLEPVSPLSSTEKRIIDLSNTIVHANCLSWLSNREPQSIDHILTDPPYGIDLNMLEQNNPHGGMNNIDRVEDTHQVESNLDLLSQSSSATK
jgi:ParB family chromosome partitioning protein